MDIQNILSLTKSKFDEEKFETILENNNFKLERIISQGQVTPENEWYDQARDEWVMVMQGAAKLLFEHSDKPVHLQAGDYINIPAHTRHRVSWTDPEVPTVWLAIHYSQT